MIKEDKNLDSWKRFINEAGDDFAQDIWEVIFAVHVSKFVGGDKDQTWAEIRAIDGVTIVTPFGRKINTTDGQQLNLRVKICCTSAVRLAPRMYVEKHLKPYMKKIPGLTVLKTLKVHKVDR